VLNYQHLLADK